MQITFAGEITSVFDTTGQLAPDVSIGTPFTATIVYDPTSLSPGVPSPFLDGALVVYQAPAPPASIEVAIGPWTIGPGPLGSGVGLGIVIADRVETSPDGDGVRWTTNLDGMEVFDVPVSLGFLAFDLLGGAGTLDSLSLVDVPLELAAWDDAGFQLDLYFGPADDEILLLGSITGLTVSVVPEPAAGLLIGLGVALAVRQRLRAAGSRSA